MLKVQKSKGIFLFTSPVIQGEDIQIVEYFGAVTGNAVYGASFLKDYFASISDRIGGRVRGYERSMNHTIEQALARMADEAKAEGANAVIGIQLSTGVISGRLLNATAIGTAIRFKKK